MTRSAFSALSEDWRSSPEVRRDQNLRMSHLATRLFPLNRYGVPCLDDTAVFQSKLAGHLR